MHNFTDQKHQVPEFNPNIPPPPITGRGQTCLSSYSGSYVPSFPAPPINYRLENPLFSTPPFLCPSQTSCETSRSSNPSSSHVPTFSTSSNLTNSQPFFNVPLHISGQSNYSSNVQPITQQSYYNYTHTTNSVQSSFSRYPNPFHNQSPYQPYIAPTYPTFYSKQGPHNKELNNTENDKPLKRSDSDKSPNIIFSGIYGKNIDEKKVFSNKYKAKGTITTSNSSQFKEQYHPKQKSLFTNDSKNYIRKDSSSDTEGSKEKSQYYSSPSPQRYNHNEKEWSHKRSPSSKHKYDRYCRDDGTYDKRFERRNEQKYQQKNETERDKLLKTYRSQYCETSEEITKRLAELANNEEKEVWIRSSPAELFYQRTNNVNEVKSTPRLDALCELFEDKLVHRSTEIKSTQATYNPPERKRKTRVCKHKSEKCLSESSDDDDEGEEDFSVEELRRKINHPYRLHPDLWHNEPGEMNDGPLCRCSAKSRRTGIRHGIYPGEVGFPKCNPDSNNIDKLYHYRITISPPTNFLTKTPTMIKYDQHEFLFEGFSLLSHIPIGELPTCKVIRFNIEYRILYIEEKIPENFTIKELDLFFKYLFHEILELVDFNVLPSLGSTEETCSCFHFIPRFVRDLENNGKEVLAMSEVLKYLLDSSGPLVDRPILERMMDMSQHEWQDYVDVIKGMVVTNPGRVPCSVRIDQLDRNVSDLEESVAQDEDGITHPVIVHFGIRPPQLSYAGNPEYQKARREYVRFRHLLANMSKPTYDDKRKLEDKENELQRMRTQGRMKRNITIAVSSKGFYRTGIMCDIVQHAMLIPVLTGHLRFHQSLSFLEKNIDYKFNDRYLLQLALTHPSYKENFGTNPDHARNSLTNCGIRQPEYGDRKIHYMNTRKRGINTLINIMSRFGKEHETASNITHNERLEFLGDAVVEFLSSIHLFFMFPDLEEGGLATYRAAIVQNQHLAVLAKKFCLDEFMLYAHGSDLCHELELRHAMANCFEALMGALLLDGGITVADKVFASALYMNEQTLKDVWENYPPHPLQEQEPLGDRQWIESYQVLKDLTKFEDSIGVKFKHIRLLARAFTDRSIGFTHLTLGSNQRLEFLGDTVLQLICSEYLYRHFPEHHEGHLSLLRSSLVNNRTQAVVCDDLGLTRYAVYSNPRAELKTKDRADLLEAFLGALYVDKGLAYCQTFCHVCLFPRLQLFIMNQDWNDPKSKLQQCCLTLRTMEGGEPDIPYYKVIQSIGPTNTRIYTVAVYFRNRRLATAEGHSIQQAEMHAAKQALQNSRELFPQLDHQKRVIVESIKRQKGNEILDDIIQENEDDVQVKAMRKFVNDFDESHLPKQYRMREDISSDEFSFDLDESKSSICNNSSRSDDESEINADKYISVNLNEINQDKNNQSEIKKRKKYCDRKRRKKCKIMQDCANDKPSTSKRYTKAFDDLNISTYNNLSSLSDTNSENELDYVNKRKDLNIKDEINKDEGMLSEKESDKGTSKYSEFPVVCPQMEVFEDDILRFKIEGAEEVSSDFESVEI